ncbi:DUF1703-domain-containing protein [Gigaspora margarita]|uniref:DUF1703-domain-containing protein n=1 Tax=Gigaspora margarita TaxID=4874 RepID=A0A8H4A5E3_GIGMA|nr:DUF1703-domain-containing protein [Gigaspora margarita]
MSFSKITRVFRRTVFPKHFVTPRVQRLRSPRSDLFQLSFSRTYNTAYWKLYEKNERLKRESIEMLDKFKALQKAKQQPPWEPSPKKQRIITQGTATLFAGKSIPIDWDHFDEIVNRGYTFIDKTSLIAEFIECASLVSLVVRPRRFGKTTNLTMLKEFFSIPIYPDNENYRHELFRDTKIAKRSCLLDSHFCKYPVIFLSLKGFDCCDTWLKMETLLCRQFALLYKEHGYINDILNDNEKLRFNKIRSGDFDYADKIISLKSLSKYLTTYHRRRCIFLIDEFDHPLEIAYRYQYYEKACGFFFFFIWITPQGKHLLQLSSIGSMQV